MWNPESLFEKTKRHNHQTGENKHKVENGDRQRIRGLYKIMDTVKTTKTGTSTQIFPTNKKRYSAKIGKTEMSQWIESGLPSGALATTFRNIPQKQEYTVYVFHHRRYSKLVIPTVMIVDPIKIQGSTSCPEPLESKKNKPRKTSILRRRRQYVLETIKSKIFWTGLCTGNR